MHTTRRPMRHLGWSATTLTLAATVVALSAPTATADVGPVNVYPCSSACNPASPIVVGQLYYLVTSADVYLVSHPIVNFYDNGQCVASTSSPSTEAHAGIGFYSQVAWVPTTPGTHTITVTQAFKTASVTVNVVAADPGSTPQQPPKQSGCTGTGSGSSDLLNSGSVDLLPGSSGL